MHVPRLPLLFAPLALALGACSDTTPAPVEPARESAGVPAADFAPAPLVTDYVWSYGQDPVPLGSATGRLCYLTGVGGRFDGSGDFVGVYLTTTGQWSLLGNSQYNAAGAEISARARCIAVASYTAETTVSSTDSPNWRHLGSSACGLTKVGGNFHDLDDIVHIVAGLPAPGTPMMIEAYSPPGGYVWGGVRCATTPPATRLGTEWSWQYPDAPVALTGSLLTRCALTGIAGRFRSTTDWVRINKAGPSWELMGAPHLGIKAWAGCWW